MRTDTPLINIYIHIYVANLESTGVCYKTLGNNLPPPKEVVSLYQTNDIGAMRLYGPNATTLNALKDTGVNLVTGVPDELLQKFAGDAAAAAATWLKEHIVAYPGVSFKYIYCYFFQN